MVFEKGGSLDLKIDQRVDVARVYRPRAKLISGKPLSRFGQASCRRKHQAKRGTRLKEIDQRVDVVRVYRPCAKRISDKPRSRFGQASWRRKNQAKRRTRLEDMPNHGHEATTPGRRARRARRDARHHCETSEIHGFRRARPRRDPLGQRSAPRERHAKTRQHEDRSQLGVREGTTFSE